jgi:putative addiction module component (TIGR02574 family)
MGSAARKILEQALALPSEERSALLEALGESLEPGDDALSPEWKAEIESRIAAVERGEAKLIPGDEVEARILRSLAQI